MSKPRKSQLLATLAVLAMLAIPTAASAEFYIPPGNSAANQYAEALPGAGGNRGGESRGPTPGEALGEGNATRLQDRGPAGQEAAQLAAETTPSAELAEADAANEANPSRSGKSSPAERDEGETLAPGGAGGSGDPPSRASAIGEVVGQATGVEGANLGFWLPIAIVAILAGSVGYWARQGSSRPA